MEDKNAMGKEKGARKKAGIDTNRQELQASELSSVFA